MFQAKDFKLGNWIKFVVDDGNDKFIYSQIERISIDNIIVEFCDNKESIDYTRYLELSEVEGIHITEDSMLKMGFKEVVNFVFDLKNVKLELIECDHDDHAYSIYESNDSGEFTLRKKEVKYIHELQNILYDYGLLDNDFEKLFC